MRVVPAVTQPNGPNRLLNYLLFAAGLMGLVVGADRLVAGAVRVSVRLGLSRQVVGIVIVGLGTSLPELVTSLDAALQGSPGAALGNVVGSNIANVLLVLGFGALCIPIRVDARDTVRDVSWMLGAALAVIAMAWTGTFERWMGLLMLVVLAVYLYRAVRSGSPADSVPAEFQGEVRENSAAVLTSHWFADLAWLLVGLVLLVGGAHFAVLGALGIASTWGMSDSLAGIILLALGTSLPELVVTVVSVLKRQSDVAVGNIVGSTLFNLLGILGGTALVLPLPVDPSMLSVHLWVMLAAIGAAAIFVRTGWRLNRVEGGALLAAYPLYMYFII